MIDVETFSPWFLTRGPGRRSPLAAGRWPLAAETVELTGPADRFSMEIRFDERFAGFAPVVPPRPRPPAAVLPRGTVAYWRFDSAGLAAAGRDGEPVADGIRARDLSGNGNDLTVRRLHDSGPTALTWSDGHHAGQPGHASLCFDGGKGPDRGAILTTAAGAFGQGFYGWIGDTRIVAGALSPRDFLAPAAP
ncbi:hypothetical protein [Streptomyces sp. B8F3]|uniref:hypothetical protein n=1 Tax=unclassified Streptomyces TaxID=2593676 RepID=UPI00325F7895